MDRALAGPHGVDGDHVAVGGDDVADDADYPTVVGADMDDDADNDPLLDGDNASNAASDAAAAAAAAAKAKAAADAKAKAAADAKAAAAAAAAAAKAKAKAASHGLSASPEAIAYVTAVHTARMLLQQRDAIELMYKSRRKNLPFAIWSIYYAPLMVNLFKSFTAYWAKFPKRSIKVFMGTLNWWLSLGPKIAAMPCRMSYSDPVKRAEKCKEALTDNFVPEEFDEEGNPRDEDERVQEVIEGMIDLGGITRALSSIGAFFVNIAGVAEGIGLLLISFPVDPFGSLIGLIAVFIGMILGANLMLIWVMLTLMMFPLVLAAVVWWWACVVFGVWYTAWLILLALLLAIPYFGLWLVDMPTGGFVTRMMHCENSPGAWHSRNMVSDDNQFIRYFPFCMRPCGSGYTVSWSGCCCDKQPAYMPDMCPQQQIYNLASGQASGGGFGGGPPVAFARYSPDAKFQSKAVDGKRSFLVDTFKRKASWYQRCYEKLTDKDFLNRHLCAVFDLLGLDDATRQHLAVVCSECYCDYQYNGDGAGTDLARMTDGHFQSWAPNGGNESLCLELRAAAFGDASGQGSQPGPALLRKVLFLSLVTLAAMLALYSMTRSGDKLMR